MPRAVKRFLGVAVERWRALLLFLVARASEPGTIRQAVVAVCAVVGVKVAPEHAEAIGWIGLGVAVCVGILTSERQPPERQPPEGES